MTSATPIQSTHESKLIAHPPFVVGQPIKHVTPYGQKLQSGTFLGYSSYPSRINIRYDEGNYHETQSKTYCLADSKDIELSQHKQRFPNVDSKELREIYEVYKDAVTTEVLDIDVVFAMAKEYLRITGGLDKFPRCPSCTDQRIEFDVLYARWDEESQSIANGTTTKCTCTGCDNVFRNPEWISYRAVNPSTGELNSQN